jgi:hypothetical protein
MSTDEITQKIQSLDSQKIGKILNSRWGWIPLIVASFVTIAKLPPEQRDGAIEAISNMIQALGDIGPATVYIIGGYGLLSFSISHIVRPYLRSRDDYTAVIQGVENRFSELSTACNLLTSTISNNHTKQNNTLQELLLHVKGIEHKD